MTIYTDSLDDPDLFRPQLAMFTRDRPAWARQDAGIPDFETVPE